MPKVDLHPDFRELLASLNSHGVKYLLLGGYAVIYYGYHRVTDDLDIWIALNAANADNKLASRRSKDLADLEYLRPNVPASRRRRKKN